jgi:hypothetical protein
VYLTGVGAPTVEKNHCDEFILELPYIGVVRYTQCVPGLGWASL